ncbi:hypothetical protein Bca4012_010156 [Brassica carinata]
MDERFCMCRLYLNFKVGNYIHIDSYFLIMQVASTINSSGAESFPIWVQDLVQGPLNKASTWPIYFTRGYLFHTRSHGQRRKTCNYGICVKGANYSDASDEVDFHGTLTDIIQLQYPGLVNLKITLFKCEWFDPTNEHEWYS